MVERPENLGIETTKEGEVIRATSPQHFVELVAAEGCKTVAARPTFAVESREVELNDGRTVTSDNYIFVTEYLSKTPGNKNVQYEEYHTGGFYKRTEFERGAAGDELSKASNIARGILTTSERLKKIRDRLPNIDTEGPLSKMHYGDRAKLINLAIEHNIKPFEHSALEEVN